MRQGGNWNPESCKSLDAFEWNEEKRKKNIAKHGIDFIDAARVLLAAHIAKPSKRASENRTMAIGFTDHRVIAVVFTIRGSICRIISARIARRAERKTYKSLLGR